MNHWSSCKIITFQVVNNWKDTETGCYLFGLRKSCKFNKSISEKKQQIYSTSMKFSSLIFLFHSMHYSLNINVTWTDSFIYILSKTLMCVCVCMCLYMCLYTHTVLFSRKVSYQESWLKNKCQPSNSSFSKYRKSVSILGKYCSLLILGNIYRHWYNFYLVGHQG